MNTKSIRIFDEILGVVCVKLPDILQEIDDGNQFQWSILHLYAVGDLGGNEPLLTLEKNINESANGKLVDWDELIRFSNRFEQIIDTVIIGVKNINLLKRYKTNHEMYVNCNVIIAMYDSTYWEIFSSQNQFINKLASKFNDIEFINSDFQDEIGG